MDNNEPNPVTAVKADDVLDRGGKRSTAPLSDVDRFTKSGVAAALCHRSPKFVSLCD